jgi:hypothetical protein
MVSSFAIAPSPPHFLLPHSAPAAAPAVIDSHDIIGTALNSSGGVASGKAVFSVVEAKEYRLAGVPCILVSPLLPLLSLTSRILSDRGGGFL